MNETLSFCAVARLFGRLLIREIDEDLVDDLSFSRFEDSLRATGIDTSMLIFERLDELAEDYFNVIVMPKGHPPLVQSLCEEGRYEASAAESVRQIADAAGVELDRDLARGAPMDHLGVELLLWSELAERSPNSTGAATSVATIFGERHLAWARRPLELMEAQGGFYGQLAGVVSQFVGLITAREIA